MAQVDRLARARGESRAAFIEPSLSLYLPTSPTAPSGRRSMLPRAG